MLLALLVVWLPIQAAGAANSTVDKAALLELLRDGEFDVLESQLTSLQAESEARDGSDEWVGVAFYAFQASDPRALERLNEWVRVMPESYAARLARGLHYWSLGWNSRGSGYANKTSEEQFADMHERFASAREDLYAAIKLNNKLSMAYALLISMANAQGLDEHQVQAVQAGLTVAPKSYHVRWMFLVTLLPQWGGSYEQIEKFVELTVAPDADDPALQRLRGFADYARAQGLQRQKKYDAALSHYDRALRHGPHWKYLYWRGKVLGRLGRAEEAVASFDQALALRPQATDVLSARGWRHFQSGRLVEALEDYTAALAVDPLDPDTLTSRAMVLRDLKRYDLALGDLNEALVQGADKSRVRQVRGHLLLFHRQDAAEALPDLERAVELAPDNIHNWYNYSAALYQLRDCRILDSMGRFQELCTAKEKACSSESLNWAQQTLQFFDSQGICPN
jgi:tetratricopeptide (TPR) repeat protein